jgi:hypothetical protein
MHLVAKLAEHIVGVPVEILVTDPPYPHAFEFWTYEGPRLMRSYQVDLGAAINTLIKRQNLCPFHPTPIENCYHTWGGKTVAQVRKEGGL